MVRRTSLAERCGLVAGLLLASVAAGCFSTGNGPDPPGNSLYYPVGLAVSPGQRALFVANSDFDLQFNGGTVAVYDLEALRAALPELATSDPTRDAAVCAAKGLAPNPERTLYPGACTSIDATPFVRASVEVGAFATDALIVARAPSVGVEAGARLFVPVRGEPSVTFFDLDWDGAGGAQTFRLACGADANDGRCDPQHRVGIDANDNTRALTLPGQPLAIAAGEPTSTGAQALVVTHDASGQVSLLTGRGGDLVAGHPTLDFVLGQLPAGSVGVAALPVPAYVRATDDASSGAFPTGYQPGFLVTYAGAPQVDLLRFADDAHAAPQRPFLQRAASTPITLTPLGYDARGIVVDADATSDRRVCEAACETSSGDAKLACQLACVDVPVAVYVAARTPPSLLVGTTRTTKTDLGTADDLVFYDSVPLAFGPSRVSIGYVIGRDGRRHKRVFAVCFDSRSIYVYDPDARRVEAVVPTGRGPHAITFDVAESIDPAHPENAHAYAYVGHFTDSYVGVVDLNEAHARTYETMMATIGTPTRPRETK